MTQDKKAQVIMLSTNNKSHIYHNKSINTLGYITGKVESDLEQFPNQSETQNQHLYIISDDEIKEGDWVYHLAQSIVRNNNNMDNLNKYGYKKIIATTDTSLIQEIRVNPYHTDKVKFYLPQPSQQFIEKYIESYNKGEIITDVLVEYEIPHDSDQLNHKNGDWDKYYSIYEKSESYLSKEYNDIIEWSFNQGKKHLQLFYKLKVNPKNNSITIKKLKDSWSREEIIKLLKQLNKDEPDYGFGSEDLDKWIEENL